MTGVPLTIVVSMMDRKEVGYFSTHSLGNMLAEAGAAHDLPAIRALTWRLIEDEAYGLADAIGAGLREAAAADDEFVRMVGAAADMVRHDIARGPIVNALVSTGKSDPSTAIFVAERLAERGGADYAAFLIGGAYGGAAERCGSVIESLAASSTPVGVAASLRSLRIAHTEHGIPDAGSIADAVDMALRVDDDVVHREAMAALLDIHCADKARTGPMIRTLAMRRQACRPMLVSRTSIDPPFDADECVDYLDVCIDGVSADNRGVVYSAYRSLAALASSRPDDVARLLIKLAGQGAYIDARAGLVIEELGRADPRKASGVILSLLDRPRGVNLDEHLPSMIKHAVKFSDPDVVAKPILDALDSRPGMPNRHLAVLAALAIEDRLGKRNDGFAGVLPNCV